MYIVATYCKNNPKYTNMNNRFEIIDFWIQQIVLKLKTCAKENSNFPTAVHTKLEIKYEAFGTEANWSLSFFVTKLHSQVIVKLPKHGLKLLDISL